MASSPLYLCFECNENLITAFPTRVMSRAATVSRTYPKLSRKSLHAGLTVASPWSRRALSQMV